MNKIFLSIGAALILTVSARADIIPVLVNMTGTGPYTWNYMANLTSEERLDPDATNGASCNGAPCTPPGTFFTIYDFAGYVPGSISATAPGWSASALLTGMTPQNISPTDSTTLTNLTFMYTGSVVAGDHDFFGFSAQSIYNNSTIGTFATQATNNSAGLFNGSTDRNIGSVPVPSAVPEPSYFLLMGLGLASFAIYSRKTKRAV